VTTTLLAVDDSKTMRKVLEMTFAGEDFRAILAENAQDALAKLRSDPPGIALVDATLGDSNGYDLCQQLKREAPQVPVLMLTSKHQPYDRARGGAVGADDFIDKPFDTQQLIDKVTTLVQKGPSAAVRPAPAVVQATQPGVGGRARAPTLAYGTPNPAPAAAAASAPAAARPPTAAFGSPAQRPAAAPAARPAAPATSLGPRPSAQPVQPVARPAPAANPGVSRAPAVAPVVERPAAAAATPAPAAAAARVAPMVAAVAAVDGQLAGKLEGLGLTGEQAQAVLALSREVVEKVVWEVVPVLAETMIKEEIARLTAG
jgi:CheY-like chemotaxis protein